MPADHRPTRAVIHLDRLLANYRLAARLSGSKTVLSVVKADAYGHGALPAARALQEAGCRWFGVATVAEALALRSNGITGEILVMGALFPGDEEDAIRAGLTCTVYDAEIASRLNARANALGERVAVHLKMDTGMSRLGFDIAGFHGFVQQLSRLDSLSVRGIYSHLSDADKVDGNITSEQGKLLETAVRTLVTTVGEVAHVHLAASAAIMQRRDTPGDMVRPGLMLYGGYPFERERTGPILQPVMQLESGLVQIRKVEKGRRVSYSGTWTAPDDTLLGVVPAGYADGIPRLLSNRGEVIVGGRRVPIRGRVCMDWIIVDLTEVPDPQVGDRVILLGREGDVTVTAEDWSAWAETIPYEIFSGITARVPRTYLSEVVT